eukprot:348243-Rhodomonas_salina.1
MTTVGIERGKGNRQDEAVRGRRGAGVGSTDHRPVEEEGVTFGHTIRAVRTWHRKSRVGSQYLDAVKNEQSHGHGRAQPEETLAVKRCHPRRSQGAN